ncbi:hypothetical protein [Marinobacter sp.]|uniref:hypothetical protein n=1 Tax=Marinobacter sp. TaxID=50741 RepID=UPI001B7CA004|nr:hypothetical protein [Marinobacter sp.]MBQ0834536.1 hypothetical protein [Marinobacter sp.]
MQSTSQANVDVAGHEVRQVGAPQEAEPAVASSDTSNQKPSLGERAMSNIRQVFDSSKTALYSLYQRELRKYPTLAGKVLLEHKIAMRVRLFNFGAASVEARKVRFPIDFLPG